MRVAFADDHELVREGLRSLLADIPGVEVVGEAKDGREAVALALATKPDVLVVDLKMPELNGVQVTQELARAGFRANVLVLTNYLDEDMVREALRAGVLGYLLKDVLRTELQRAIETVALGKPYLHPEVQHQLMQQAFGESNGPLDGLSPRELEALQGIAKGLSNKEIATHLGVSEGTVKGYVSSMFVKIGVSDRTQAALFAIRNGMGGLQ
jgi:NarL family two-component system response regulator LiaR